MTALLSLVVLARSGALAEAVKSGNADTVRVLLAAGADPNQPDPQGLRPLDFAAFLDRTPVAGLLLESHARLDYTVDGSGPLDIAVSRGSVETARLLIDSGGDVRRVYPSGRTPLHIAAAAGLLPMAELLIDRGADVNIRDKGGFSPLDEAVRRNYTPVVALLLEAGATPRPGMLRDAVRMNRLQLVKALVPHATQPLGPLLVEALSRHQSEVADVLMKAGADVNARDGAGFTPLHDAALAGKVEAVRMLLEHGADIDAGDRDSGATALYMAATMGREEVVTLLLEKGADPRKGPSAVKAAKSGGFDKIAAAIQAKVDLK